ncbi:hypothetical protein, partial [Puia sp.]|uniref:hypothetical protein n=1 Tax=Puia sp. TaxID=2045100 RepID=UPI002F40B175
EKAASRDEAFEEEDLNPSDDVGNISIQRQVLQAALETLSDEQRYILMVYVDYGALMISRKLGQNPDDEREMRPGEVTFKKIRALERKRLCEELNITEGNLRVIKFRAVRKVLNYIKIHT